MVVKGLHLATMTTSRPKTCGPISLTDLSLFLGLNLILGDRWISLSVREIGPNATKKIIWKGYV